MTEREHNDELEAAELETLRRERLENLILADRETFDRVVEAYLNHRQEDGPTRLGLLHFGVELLIKDEAPAYNHAWEVSP